MTAPVLPFQSDHFPEPADLAELLSFWPATLLNGVELIAGKHSARLAEVELYYHSAAHPDPFPHRYPLQRACGSWYLHRAGQGFRGGSYKGIDFTVGSVLHGIYCGWLIRTLEPQAAQRVEGPSRCVDWILQAIGVKTVAELDALTNHRDAVDVDNPLHLRASRIIHTESILRTPRIGLSLKRAGQIPSMRRYWGLPYRFTRVQRIQHKGRPGAILTLHQQGLAPEAILACVGGTRRGLTAAITEFERGRATGDLARYFGQTLTTTRWCQVYGAWTVECNQLPGTTASGVE